MRVKDKFIEVDAAFRNGIKDMPREVLEEIYLDNIRTLLIMSNRNHFNINEYASIFQTLDQNIDLNKLN